HRAAHLAAHRRNVGVGTAIRASVAGALALGPHTIAPLTPTRRGAGAVAYAAAGGITHLTLTLTRRGATNAVHAVAAGALRGGTTGLPQRLQLLTSATRGAIGTVGTRRLCAAPRARRAVTGPAYARARCYAGTAS